jgi:YHS domain-containing protein
LRAARAADYSVQLEARFGVLAKAVLKIENWKPSMKNSIYILFVILAIVAVSCTRRVAEVNEANAKPYPLKTCLICGMELGGSMGKPYSFVYQGQEIKTCDQSEKAIFDKDPDKYMKKLAVAEAASIK